MTHSTVMERIIDLTFENGQTAEAIRLHRSDSLLKAVETMGFRTAHPVLVLVGGASGLDETYQERLRSLFSDVLVPVAQNLGAVIVDGGTDAGIMQMIGQARTQNRATFPLVGVAAIGSLILPKGNPHFQSDSTPSEPYPCALEPNHTHFFLTPGAFWGDESPWMARIATMLSYSQPSVTVLINGGKITLEKDAFNSIRENRRLIVVGDSGRTAETLADALKGNTSNHLANELVRSGLLQSVALADGLEGIATVLHSMLSAQTPANTP